MFRGRSNLPRFQTPRHRPTHQPHLPHPRNHFRSHPPSRQWSFSISCALFYRIMILPQAYFAFLLDCYHNLLGCQNLVGRPKGSHSVFDLLMQKFLFRLGARRESVCSQLGTNYHFARVSGARLT